MSPLAIHHAYIAIGRAGIRMAACFAYGVSFAFGTCFGVFVFTWLAAGAK